MLMPGESTLKIFHSIVLTALVMSALAGPVLAQEGKGFAKDNFYMDAGQQLMIEVHVWGEVNKPGLYRVPDGSSVLDVISTAGGPTQYAALSRVKLTHIQTQQPRTVKIDLNDYLSEDKPDSLPVLKPGDTVMVPRNLRSFWKDAISVIADVAVIVNVYYLISHNR
jgi:hypothetical protein